MRREDRVEAREGLQRRRAGALPSERFVENGGRHQQAPGGQHLIRLIRSGSGHRSAHVVGETAGGLVDGDDGVQRNARGLHGAHGLGDDPVVAAA